jgi:site-specific recombinase XerD
VTADLQAEWLRWLRETRGRSQNTAETYARSARSLGVPLETATREDIEEWWRRRATDSDGNPRPHNSRNNELSALRSFYHWAQRFEHRADDPTIRLDSLREQKRMSRFVGDEDFAKLMRELPPDLRRACALGAYAGMRVSEVAELHWSDVNQDLRRIIPRGKGDKERHVGLPVALLSILLPDTGGNVVTGREDAYSGHYLQMKVNKAIKALGVDGTFHKLRHRFGYKAAAAGIAPTSLARAMGHESLSTTMGYIAAVDSDLDLIAEAVSR